MATEKLNEFTTASGVTLKLLPVSTHLIQMVIIKREDELRAEGKILDVPTYTTRPDAGGERHEEPLTEDIINTFRGDEQETDVKAKWAAYQASRVRRVQLLEEVRIQATFAIGIDYEIPKDDETAAFFEMASGYFKLDVPTDPRDRKVFYLIHKPVINQLEISQLDAQIAALSSGGEVDAEKIAFFRANTRGYMGRQVSAIFDRFNDTPEPVAGDAEIPGVDDGEGVEDQAE